MLKRWHFAQRGAAFFAFLLWPLMCFAEEPIRIVIPQSELDWNDTAEGTAPQLRISEKMSSADEAWAANQLEQDAQLLFRDGRYPEAIAKFEQAYSLSHKSELLYNMAVSYSQMEAWGDCSRTADRYLATVQAGTKRTQAENLKQTCVAKLSNEQRLKSQGGRLFVDCSIVGAQLFVDGQPAATTPLKEPLALASGTHQVKLERDGYKRVNESVEISRDQTTKLDAFMSKEKFTTSWRSPVGWTAVALGALSVGGGILAWQLSEDEYRDSSRFNRLANWERVGYSVGGIFMAGGAGLLVWEFLRDQIDERDRNPAYRSSSDSQSARGHFSLLPGGLAYGTAF